MRSRREKGSAFKFEVHNGAQAKIALPFRCSNVHSPATEVDCEPTGAATSGYRRGNWGLRASGAKLRLSSRPKEVVVVVVVSFFVFVFVLDAIARQRKRCGDVQATVTSNWTRWFLGVGLSIKVALVFCELPLSI